MVFTDSAPFRDSMRSVADRAADLLGRMTLEEKLGQLGSAWVFQMADNDGFDIDRAAPLLSNGLGHLTRASGASSFTAVQAATLANELQTYLRDNTRLGIPAIIHEEICSGLMASQATVYPQALGVAATFSPAQNHALADTVRTQMRAMGAHHGLSPVLDVCRDPRWGRTEETYGEDPLLVSLMGNSFIKGLQGSDDGADMRSGVAATAKHFVGYGASEGGLNWAPAHIGQRELREVYLRPFEAAVRDAGLASIMNGYHELDGIPCGANRWLLRDVLREEWGFEGTVVADYFAVKQLSEYHNLVESLPEAGALALAAGIDVELPSTECYGSELATAIQEGTANLADVDSAVLRVLESKFRLGLFEEPLVDVGQVVATTRTAPQIELSKSLAAQSLVLLRNDGCLPLDPATKSIALIGPNAASARHLLGDYSYVVHVESLIEVLKSGNNVFAMPLDPEVDIAANLSLDHVVSVDSALRAALPEVDISYEQGCSVLGDDRSGFADAVELAAKSDVAIMVMGERSGLTEDCTTGESRDVSSLSLSGVQESLVSAVAETGTPVVLVLVAGRPVGSPAVHEACAAVLMAWLPGEQGGTAIVDALVGKQNPGGKLPITYPRSSGQIPIYYGHKVSGGRSHWKGPYVDESNEPLYPFGFGLSYSTFEVAGTVASASSAPVDGAFTVLAEVTNTGSCFGDEVVQLYGSDPVASVTRPVRELLAFARVSLGPGQRKVVRFEVPVSALGFCGVEETYVVEPGAYDFVVGTSSQHLSSVGRVDILGDAPTVTIRSTCATKILQD